MPGRSTREGNQRSMSLSESGTIRIRLKDLLSSGNENQTSRLEVPSLDAQRDAVVRIMTALATRPATSSESGHQTPGDAS